MQGIRAARAEREKWQMGVVGLPGTCRGMGISVCERAQVKVRAGRERGLTWELGSEKSTTRSGHQSGQKSSPVKRGRGLRGLLPQDRRGLLPPGFSFWTLGGEGGSSVSAARVPPALGCAAEPFPPRRAEEGAARLFAAPPLGDRAVGGGDRQVASRPLGAASAVFGGRCAFCFVLILSEVASSAGGRARRARGSASDTCEEAATACGARAPGRAGRAKVQV